MDAASANIREGSDPPHTTPAIEAIIDDLHRPCETPVPAEELKRTKAYVRGGILLGIEGTQQVAGWLGSQESLRNKIMDGNEMIARVDAVTSQGIQRLTQFSFA